MGRVGRSVWQTRRSKVKQQALKQKSNSNTNDQVRHPVLRIPAEFNV